jgi:hypothetical protein
MILVRLVALAALALALSACADDEPEPRVDPTPTTSTSTSPTSDPTSTGPVEPPSPQAAASASKSGVEAFISYFWDLANYAQATGDTKTLRNLGAGSCGGCQGAFDFIDEVYGAGGSITGGEYTLGNLETKRLVAETNDVVIFRSTFPTTNTRQVVRQPGKKADVYEASTVRARFTLSYQADGWQVDIWEVLR